MKENQSLKQLRLNYIIKKKKKQKKKNKKKKKKTANKKRTHKISKKLYYGRCGCQN